MQSRGREQAGPRGGFPSSNAMQPKSIADCWQATRSVLRRFADDPNDLNSIRSYFTELFWQNGRAALDAADVGGRPGILLAIAERTHDLTFPFASIAQAFRLIDNSKEPIVVPWRSDESDEIVARLLDRLASSQNLTRSDLRRLQPYTVGIPQRIRAEWLVCGMLQRVHDASGDGVLKLKEMTAYDPQTGVVPVVGPTGSGPG